MDGVEIEWMSICTYPQAERGNELAVSTNNLGIDFLWRYSRLFFI
jgi:hypothetical protein